MDGRCGWLGDAADIERVASTGSTQADLLARLAADPLAVSSRPLLRVAEVQIAGRGRLGRRWVSSPAGDADASLTFSLAVRFARADLSALSLVVGVAVAEALDSLAGPGRTPIGLKWPNDLCLVDGAGPAAGWRKLGGILIETVPRPPGRVAVIGVGVNIGRVDVAGAPYAIASLDERVPGATAEAALRTLAPALLAAAIDFDRDGFSAAWRARYAGRDVLLGRPASARGAVGAVAGVGAGIAADGALLIEGADGRVVAVTSGAVDAAVDATVDAVERAPC